MTFLWFASPWNHYNAPWRETQRQTQHEEAIISHPIVESWNYNTCPKLPCVGLLAFLYCRQIRQNYCDTQDKYGCVCSYQIMAILLLTCHQPNQKIHLATVPRSRLISLALPYFSASCIYIWRIISETCGWKRCGLKPHSDADVRFHSDWIWEVLINPRFRPADQDPGVSSELSWRRKRHAPP